MQNRLNLGCRGIFEEFAAQKEVLRKRPLKESYPVLCIDVPFFHKKGEDRKREILGFRTKGLNGESFILRQKVAQVLKERG